MRGRRRTLAQGAGGQFVYGASQWEPELVSLRAGGLIPIARQYPGAREFVEAHTKEYLGAGLSYHSASGYSGCQIDAVQRVGAPGHVTSDEAYEEMRDAGAIPEDPVWWAEDILLIERAKKLLLA